MSQDQSQNLSADSLSCSLNNSSPDSLKNAVNGLVLVTGGARSGKSSFAVELGQRFESHDPRQDVTFLATAQPLDEDMRARIANHQATRPRWVTLECPLDIQTALSGIDESCLVIIDCLTLWVSNLIFDGLDEKSIVACAQKLARFAAQRSAPTIVVTNDVGLGIVPENELARGYRDILGRVNSTFAVNAGRTLFFSAGRAIELKSPTEFY